VKRWRLVAAVSATVGVAALGGALWGLARALQTPFRGYEEAARFVAVPPGAAVAAIGTLLEANGIVRDRRLFRVAVWWRGAERVLQAGEYRFDRPLTPFEVVDKLVRGEVFLQPITFPEGLTIREMARLYEQAGFGPAPAFLEASRRVDLIAAVDPAATDLEGYLFPDTYALPRRASADLVAQRMVRRFLEVFDQPLRQAAAERGLSVREAVTLASLVEKETARPEERPLVAAVFLNRLRRGMLLQCDPTVIYALTKAGKYDGNLRRGDLAFDSPYNTYRYAGLPPGPIAAPGRAALEAAVRPAPVDYLYFVSRNDGSHVFARTLAEHAANVRRYQIALLRPRRAGAPAPVR
jgi:UPF0755 protein